MADSLKFILSLVDKTTPAGKTITKTLLGAQRGLATLNKWYGTAQRGAQKLAPALRVVGTAAKYLATGVATAGVAALGLGAVGAKMAVDAGTFREKTLFALGILTKSGQEGNRVYDQLLRMSRFFNEDPKETLSSFQTLLSKGFKTDDAIKAMQVLGDLKLTAPDANMEALVRAFGQIKSKPKLALEELKTQLGDAGLDLGLAYDEIGKLIGKKATDVEKAISAGQVDSNVGLLGIMNAIMRSSGSKSAGEQMAKFSKSTQSLAKGILSLPEQYMLSMSVNGGGLQKLLSNVLEVLSPDSPTGKKILGFLNEVAGDAAGMFDGISAEDVKDTLLTIGKIVKGTGTAFKGFWTELKIGFTAITGPMGKFGGGAITLDKVMGALGTTLKFTGAVIGVTLGLIIMLASGVVSAVTWIANGIDSFAKGWSKWWRVTMPNAVLDAVSWFSAKYYSLVEAGENIVGGLWEGISKKWKDLVAKFKGLLSSLPDTVKKALGIASPAKPMIPMGKWTVAGITKGINDNADGPAEALRGIATSLPAAATPVGGGRSAGGGVSFAPKVELHFHIDGSNQSAQQLAEAAEPMVERVLFRLLDRAALQMAAAPLAATGT